MSSGRILCLQIAALGGQGGGVLVNWLEQAARIEGYPCQATSIPGVAQRTGATTYYFELLAEANADAQPIFSLFPDTGDLDLLAALEPTEAARAVEHGLIGPKTTVITASRRIYSTAEKIVAGDGRTPAAGLLESIRGAAAETVVLDFEALADETGSMTNAVLFGALFGSGVLPLSAESGRRAIELRGVGVDSGLRGFDSGFAALTREQSSDSDDPAPKFLPVPETFRPVVEQLPTEVRAMAGHGLSRLLEYQGEDYARLYLDRLNSIVAADVPPFRLAVDVAKRLAAWMQFEDVIHVARQKSRPGRLREIADSVGADADEPLKVVDYLKPGRAEFAGTLPHGIGRIVGEGGTQPRGGGGMRITATSITGQLAYRALAGLKRWRPYSYRYQVENRMIDQWLGSILATGADQELALKIAHVALLARGYGSVRRRGLRALERLFGDAGDGTGESAVTEDRVDRLINIARNDPDAIDRDSGPGG